MQRLVPLFPYALIFFVVTMTALPTLQSGTRINRSWDFFQYASRHEAVRRGLLEYHALPLRSHWLGGGVPTIGDPEDPTLNPLVSLSVVFGTVTGLKLIGYLAVLCGGLATYALARNVLEYTFWGALYAALVCGTSLFVPLRLLDGNTNEIYSAFLPLCLLLLAWARRRKIALVILPFLLYTMLSDGKANALMTMVYIGVLTLAAMIPSIGTLSPAGRESTWSHVDHRPFKYFLLALGLTALIGMVRILPAAELMHSRGGLQQMLPSHEKTYRPATIAAYTVDQLWKEAVGFDGQLGLVTVGWIPVLLTGIAFMASWRTTLAWGVCLLLFSLLALAHHAPLDLLRLLWHLPVFDTISRPNKYFSFQIAFTLALVAGRGISLLRYLPSRQLEAFCALALTVLSVGFLYPKAHDVHRRTYTTDVAAVRANPGEGFFQIQGLMNRIRADPPNSLAYFNVRRNVGTIDWYTGVPAAAYAVPKYFVDRRGDDMLNPAYRGEAFFEDSTGPNAVSGEPVFQPNSIVVPVAVNASGILVINQNYHPDWMTNHGTLIDLGGRLALGLDDTGNYAVHLRYRPRSFYGGLALTMSSVLCLIWVCWTYRAGQLARWAQDDRRIRRNWSRAILWATD